MQLRTTEDRPVLYDSQNDLKGKSSEQSMEHLILNFFTVTCCSLIFQRVRKRKTL